MEYATTKVTYACQYRPAPKPQPPKVILAPSNLKQACQMAGISVEDARGRDRTKATSRKRFHVMAILWSWGRNASHIGRLLSRDHSTVLSGIRRWNKIQSELLEAAE